MLGFCDAMKKYREIVFVTSNMNKLRECAAVLREFNVVNHKIDIPEFQGEPEFVLMEKAEFAAKRLKEPCFVDDTSLCFEAWNGLPGPYIKDFLAKIGVDRIPLLLSGFNNKRATMICYIGYCEPGKKPVAFHGVTEGKIVKPREDRNFGFDPIFQPNGSKKTQAEMAWDEKKKVSARTKALKKMSKYLKGKIRTQS